MCCGMIIHDIFLKRLNEKPFKGEVHSVFKSVINIIDDDGEIYSLLGSSMDMGPESIILDIEDLSILKVVPCDMVYITKEEICIQKTKISMKDLKAYSLKLPYYKSDLNSLKKNICYVWSRVNDVKDSYQTSIISMMEKMLNERRLILKNKLRSNDLVGSIQSSIELLGLGQGLTPSGDDILLGLFSVILMNNSPLNELDGIPELITLRGEGLTNELSLSGLKRASNGMVRQRISDFVRDFAHGSEIKNSLEAVLEIGHTSGRDITLGILTGFELILEKEEANGNKDSYEEKYIL